MPVTIRDIEDARSKIAGSVIRTPCLESIPLSELTGSRIFCKFENLQRTGSFKERGARYALLALTPEQCRPGVIAASAGNQALGLAWHGGLLGIPVMVVMPKGAPLIKITTCEQIGAHVILHGATFDEAKQHAQRLGQERGLHYIKVAQVSCLRRRGGKQPGSLFYPARSSNTASDPIARYPRHVTGGSCFGSHPGARQSHQIA